MFSADLILAPGESRPADTLMYESDDASDTTSLSAPLAALSASYRFFDKTPLTLRVWAGAMRARIKHDLAGTFAGPVGYESDAGVREVAEVNQRVAVFEPATNVWVPLVGPEVRFGYRWGKHLMVDLGVAGFLFFGPSDARKGSDSSIGDPEDRPTVLENISVTNAKEPVKPGIISQPREKSIGTFFGVMPTVAVRVDF